MIRICPIVRSKVPLLGTFLRSDSWLAPHALALRRAICKNVALRSYSVNSEQPKHTFDISKLTRNEIQQLRELKRARERKFKRSYGCILFQQRRGTFLGFGICSGTTL
ncbi:AIF_collapsed_G0056480.mRNA.1.CDS.1 [Saccharomyces cerevisiae]|nr:AIF_collapsed_G0056480.mRNA.1.CDS.1 [Saccharomyces cerevisiae]